MHPASPLGTAAKIRTTLLAATALASMAAISSARADDAKAMFKAMSDSLASQKAISFKYDSNLDVVTPEGQKMGLASSGAVTLNRPDKVHATRVGGFADVEFAYDGKTMTLLGRNANAYTKVNAPGSIDQIVDDLRDKYHRLVPAADLLMSNPYEQLMPGVTDAKDLGSGVIGGVECDHLAFRTPDFDWQIWITQGANPHPCRYEITSKNVKGSPEYRIDVTDWKEGAAVTAGNFTVALPANARQVDIKDLPKDDEMGGPFQMKAEN